MFDYLSIKGSERDFSSVIRVSTDPLDPFSHVVALASRRRRQPAFWFRGAEPKTAGAIEQERSTTE